VPRCVLFFVRWSRGESGGAGADNTAEDGGSGEEWYPPSEWSRRRVWDMGQAELRKQYESDESVENKLKMQRKVEMGAWNVEYGT
jgi:hypothetical protein